MTLQTAQIRCDRQQQLDMTGWLAMRLEHQGALHGDPALRIGQGWTVQTFKSR